MTTSLNRPASKSALSRRSFLAGFNLALGGLCLGLFPGQAQAAVPPPGWLDTKAPGLRPNVFIHVAPSGDVTFMCHRSEMGQGVRSTLPVLFADELGADLARVQIVQADGDKAYGNQNTDGSSSVRGVYETLRRTAATARIMLERAGARALGVPVQECVAERHRIVHRPSGRAVGFGELALAAAKLPVPTAGEIKLRPEAELQHVGKALPLLDGKAYVTGQARYGADVSLPGQLIAVIARPPVVGGRVVSVDDTEALKVPGVRRVIRMPEPQKPYVFQPWGGVAVLADNTWAAMRGRAKLSITWDEGENAVYDSMQYRQTLAQSVSKPGTVLRKVGDVEAALKGAVRTHEAEYFVPHLPHSPMEPPAALAHVTQERCEVWTSTQNPQAARTEAARALGWSEDKVAVHVTFLGGGFGRKSKADFVSEAVVLSREAGQPVRVQWTREDDLRHDYYNTVSHQRLTAGLDAQGKVVAWRHRTAFPPIGTLWNGKPVPSAGDLQQGVLDLALDIPNVAAEGCEAPAYTRIGWLRSVYNIFHAFAIGSFVDELAELKGQDPKETWLEIIGPARAIRDVKVLGIEKLPNYGASIDEHPVDAGRLRGVIERVTEVAGWAQRRARGEAVGLAAHRSFLSYVAVVAKVGRDARGGLRVEEAWVAVDAGKVLNLDRARSQMEGAIVFGMSLALHGGITMKGGAVEQSNFRDFKLIRIGEAPASIHVEILQNGERPGGIGEPGVPPVAPAIASAAYALTRRRLRELPLRLPPTVS